jgi:hypothetical protein
MTIEENEEKLKALRAKAMNILRPHIPTLIFVSIVGYMLNWTLEKYGEPKLIIACTLLIATLLFTRGRS